MFWNANFQKDKNSKLHNSHLPSRKYFHCTSKNIITILLSPPSYFDMMFYILGFILTNFVIKINFLKNFKYVYIYMLYLLQIYIREIIKNLQILELQTTIFVYKKSLNNYLLYLLQGNSWCKISWKTFDIGVRLCGKHRSVSG